MLIKIFFGGVDSASRTTSELLSCVQKEFGDPAVWGRYLENKEGVSFGLTPDEVQLLHEKGISFLVIYNHFTEGTTYDKGVAEAELALQYAKEINVPEGVALFANVEPEYPIDAEFILGWYDTISPSQYKPAIYGYFSIEGDVRSAYDSAVTKNPELGEQMIVWTNQPQKGITTEGNAPEFNPDGPKENKQIVWQYGIDAETCNIDTILFEESFLEYVWRPE
ncbi:glycoside hydrolase domain-containing protein [Bacillus solitudinis]|uniref:glycoside hydrolase domain-containing protein n=1 Tax=Bacillus solitudinis TaxID=2014074 RepID=UPI0012FD568A|nr:glycoside hydrolase domain-containing protein [Bacillus solitudinis]